MTVRALSLRKRSGQRDKCLQLLQRITMETATLSQPREGGMIPYTAKRNGLKRNHHHIERESTMMIRDNKSILLEGKGVLLVILVGDVKRGRGGESESVQMTPMMNIGEGGPREGRGHVREIERKGITGGKNDRDTTRILTQTEYPPHPSDMHSLFLSR